MPEAAWTAFALQDHALGEAGEDVEVVVHEAPGGFGLPREVGGAA